MQTHEIRERFIHHFVAAGHTEVPSASLILDDPNLLFVNAGMVPFKPYFLGQQNPPFAQGTATSIQKCVRTLDIDEVGITTRHNTFFQMAGNFSFGQYFKEGAITHAWTLLTGSVEEGGYGLDPERLWVTVYLDDDEAADIWHEKMGVPRERIQRLGMEDNYWSMGIPGPCGPSSEIYYDRGPEYGKEGGPIADDNRYMEIWNLVFMENERGEGTGKGNFEIVGPLPKKNIDTGLGVERVACILQGVDNVYETDLLRPVIEAAEKITGTAYEDPKTDRANDIRFRVIADHSRTAMMIILDGVTPSNEGRGYILRRLLRRIVRSARLLGATGTTMESFMNTIMDTMTPSYPEIAENRERILRVALAEEAAFLRTLESGTHLFEQAVASLREQRATTVSGRQAFELHDTYGFPIDLTLEMATEAGLEVDMRGFEEAMAEQKSRAKADSQAKKHGHADLSVYREFVDNHPTEFVGYTELEAPGTVLGLLSGGALVGEARQGQEVEVILDSTPMYAEAGGQLGDRGQIRAGDALLDVHDVQKIGKKLWVHKATVAQGGLDVGSAVTTTVDGAWRHGARQAHSATHLIHAALRQVLGPTAVQAGSLNRPGYLRFDFNYTGQLSPEQVREIEAIANQAVDADWRVNTTETSLEEAKKMGAMALFGENYGDVVRVVEIGGPFSMELCGGTHVGHSSQIGPVSVLGESSVGSGRAASRPTPAWTPSATCPRRRRWPPGWPRCSRAPARTCPSGSPSSPPSSRSRRRPSSACTGRSWRRSPRNMLRRPPPSTASAWSRPACPRTARWGTCASWPRRGVSALGPRPPCWCWPRRTRRRATCPSWWPPPRPRWSAASTRATWSSCWGSTWRAGAAERRIWPRAPAPGWRAWCRPSRQ